MRSKFSVIKGGCVAETTPARKPMYAMRCAYCQNSNTTVYWDEDGKEHSLRGNHVYRLELQGYRVLGEPLATRQEQLRRIAGRTPR